jgi:hypothetical protein
MGILRGVSGKVLGCGCLIGVYETYTGEVVHVIDAVSETCKDHRKGEAVSGPGAQHADRPDAKA